MSLWGHTGSRSDRRVLNRRRGRPGPRLAVRRGAVGVGVVQGLGPVGAREGLAGSRRGYGTGGFRPELSADAHGRGPGRGDRPGVIQLGRSRPELSADAYSRGPGRGDRPGVIHLGNTVGVYDHAAGRGTRHGVAQLEVTIGVYDRPVSPGPRDRMTRLGTNALCRKPS